MQPKSAYSDPKARLSFMVILMVQCCVCVRLSLSLSPTELKYEAITVLQGFEICGCSSIRDDSVMAYLNHRIDGVHANQGKNIARNGDASESELHCLEREAYTSVLRTFCAQSSTLSWGKEGLLTELRTELRVSDMEHRDILAVVSSDRSIKLLREKVNQASKRQKIGTSTTPSPNYAIPSPKTGPPLLTKNRMDGKLGGLSAHKSAPPPVFYHKSQNQNRQEKLSRVYKKTSLSASGKNIVSDVIRIRATDKLIYEVNRVFGKENPNPAIIEKAKLLLQDQEKALMEAINKIGAVSDAEKWSVN